MVRLPSPAGPDRIAEAKALRVAEHDKEIAAVVVAMGSTDAAALQSEFNAGVASLCGKAVRTPVQGPKGANSSGQHMYTGAPVVSGDGHIAIKDVFDSEFEGAFAH